MKELDNIQSLPYLLPEFTLAGTILLLFLGDLLMRGKVRLRWLTFIAVCGSLLAFLFTLTATRMESAFLFNRMIVFDPFANFFKALMLCATVVILLISKRNSETNRMNQGEYFALLLSLCVGGFFLVASTDLLMAYLSLEFVSLGSYVLAGYAKENRASSEASMKYVIYGGVSSGAMIYGMSFLYGLSGSLDFVMISKAISQLEPSSGTMLTLFVATLLILAGLGYKIACVPFHMWCPDVYEGSPTPVTAFFSVVPKVAGFGILVRFFYTAMATTSVAAGTDVAPAGITLSVLQGVNWPLLLAALSCATMTLGNLVALHQDSLKRLLAYSSIAHAGYILMAIVVLDEQGINAILFYLAVYFIMNMGAFLVVIMIKEATGSDHIDRFRGLGWRGGYTAFVALAMTVFFFSLTGIPPTAGFIGKVYIFGALINKQWYWLALVGLINSVISLYYYARVIKTMFFVSPAQVQEESEREVDAPKVSRLEGVLTETFILRYDPLYTFLLAVLLALTLVLGLYWTPLAEQTSRSVALLLGR